MWEYIEDDAYSSDEDTEVGKVVLTEEYVCACGCKTFGIERNDEEVMPVCKSCGTAINFGWSR